MRSTHTLKKISGVLLLVLVLSGRATADSATPAYVEINEPGLVAHLYMPDGPGPFAAVVAVSGSEGGISTGDAFGKLLVPQGFAVLGVAYFGMPGLPKFLDRIPLERFVRAVDLLQGRAGVDPQRIAIVGGSKGGELALVVAAIEPRIRSVCAFVPSSVVWQSARAADQPTSSWTFHGLQLPFVPYKGPITPASGRLADLFDASLTQARAVAAANIPVERINGPVLLISADQDEIWPSRPMSEMIMQRLDQQKFSFPYRHVHFDTPHMFTKETAPQVERAIIDFLHATTAPKPANAP